MADNPEYAGDQQDPALLPDEPPPVVRARKRMESLKLDHAVITDRIKNFYDKDQQERVGDIDARLQRYAKYRQWTEGKTYPFENCTDSATADMMTASMRLQDTLHNAVMGARPPITPKAVKKQDKEKEENLTHLLDYQFFEDQPGEQIIGALADDFVNEGVLTAYIPWIDEKRTTRTMKVYPEIPNDANPLQYFGDILQGLFPQGGSEPTKAGWDWKVTDKDGKKRKACFFTRDDGMVELDIERDAIVFDGPRVIRKDVQHVLHPSRCENLQIQGPSNPNGAPHVILIDFPSVDEIKRLAADGFYDLLTEEDEKKLGIARMDTSYQEREQQKDVMQGIVEQKEVPKGAESHKQLTRLMCFDCYDIDGDGLDEDVIFWMILETKTLLRAKYLTQMFPADPPRRPFAEANLFPVPGRRLGISLLEMMEGIHDLMKQFFDMGGDAGIIANLPIWFYRASSNMRPETIRLQPGEGYPLGDPKNDVYVPQLGSQNQSFMFNMLSFLQQTEERLTTIGDLQVGRVPHGKSSALRTVSGMQTILAQGDARPERVLRRFFIGLAQIWQGMHTLNQTFLKKGKQYMVAGYVKPKDDPYRTVEEITDVQGQFRFTFSANVLNTSKEAVQQALQAIMGVVLTPLMMQMGVTTKENAYRLAKDFVQSYGQNPDKYVTPPSPDANEPGIFAEEALAQVFAGNVPVGKPLEGAEMHLAKLYEYINSDKGARVMDPTGQMVDVPGIVGLPATSRPILYQYLQKIGQMAQEEKKQAALMAAASQFSGQAGQPQLPGPQGQGLPEGARAMPPVNGNELVDESLPTAGGGANHQNMMQ